MPSFFSRLPVIVSALALFLLVTASANAEPGWMNDAIRNAKAITPHEDAPAIVLSKHIETNISSDGKVKSKVRLVSKILSPAGSEYAVLQESESSIRDVKGLKGWLVKANGEKQTLDKEHVARFGMEQETGYYHDAFLLSAVFPDAVSGDVVAYEYDVIEKGSYDCLCQSFQFQRSIPVVSTRYEVTVPHDWKLRMSGQNLEPVEDSTGEDIFVWKSGYLPYRPDEPHMPSWGEVARRVEYCCYDPFNEGTPTLKDWSDVSEWARSIHDPAAAPDDSIRGQVHRLCQGLTTTEDKLNAIAAYVRDEIRYVAVEIGIGRFQPRPAGSTFLNRYGDCKDKATLLRAMLTEAGIPSVPVLANAGHRVDPDFPSAFQFNHVILAIPLDSLPGLEPMPKASADGWLFFDPTHTYLSLGRLPSVLHGSLAMPFSSDDTVLCELPALAPSDRYRRYDAVARLSEDYVLEAEVTITDYGNWAADMRRKNATTATKDQTEDLVRRFARSIQDVALDNYSTGDDADSAWAKFTLRGKPMLTQAGELCLIKADFFHADVPDDFSEKERVHPIWFGRSALVETNINWILPGGLSFEAGHDVIADSCAAASIVCETAAEGNNLDLKSVTTYFGKQMPVEEYSQARSFDRKTGAATRYRAIITKDQDGADENQDSL